MEEIIMKKVINVVSMVALLALLLTLSPVAALAQDEVVCESDVVVQADDWLSKLADKFYGDVLAYQAIADATNAKNATDDTYAKIDNPDIIEPGWKLCIPPAESAQATVDVAAEETAVEMDALIAAAKEEGMLTTIALPHDWLNYGVMIENYKAKYGADPIGWSIYSYNGMLVVLDSIKRAAPALDKATDVKAKRAAVLDAMRATKDLNGVSGKITFDANGDPTTYLMSGFLFKDGKYVWQQNISGDMTCK